MSRAITAAARGFALCHACGQLARHGEGERCPRCVAPLQQRKPDSLNRAWAFLAAAAILYIPANLLPIMVTASILGTQEDTIMSGVAFLWVSGSWMLAAVVFCASVLIPLLKLIALALLLVTTQRRLAWKAKERSDLYQFLELIGRWSMLDVFVVTILFALVQAKSFATIAPGPGLLAFGAVVVLGMLATMAFDPRLIWDPLSESPQDPHHA